MNKLRLLPLATVVVLTASCSDDGGGATGDAGGDGSDDAGGVVCNEDTDAIPFATLAEYCFFEGDGSTQVPVDGVVPYEVNVELFADEAIKFRFLVLPDGETIEYDAEDTWTFPVGTIIIKSFGYYTDYRDPSLGFTLLETRLLIRRESEWQPVTYQWNDEQTEAVVCGPGSADLAFQCSSIGANVPIDWIDADGDEHSLDYRIPSTDQCRRCHGQDSVSDLGPHTRQLNRDNVYDDAGGEAVNQLTHFEALGMFSEPLPPSTEWGAFPSIGDTAVEVVDRARGYLDANCSHCHQPGGAAAQSGLVLDYRETEPVNLGVCRSPFSAGAGTGGRLWDIQPGRADESVMVFRMESTDPSVKMPEPPSQLSDPAGAALITEWINGMPDVDCAGAE